MNFRSDNEAPAAPEILEALARVNQGSAHAYGDDAVTERLRERFCELFEKQVAVYPVTTGTAANCLCVGQLCPPYGAIFCYEHAHLYEDECGAPEFYTGGKLLPLPAVHGKLQAAELAATLSSYGPHGDHASKPSALSLTQATEHGTVYSLEELGGLCEVAHAQGLGVHMDGARFANALVTLGCSPAQMTWRQGVDMLSFGATKNGAFAAEAVIVLNPAYGEQLSRRRKRAGHLWSKMRFISAQLEAYLHADLWLRLAQRANEQASALASGLQDLEGVEVCSPTDANEVFARLPSAVAVELRAAGFEFHDWTDGSVRLVTSHATEASSVERFLVTARAAVNRRTDTS